MVAEHIHELARRGLNLYFCWIGLRSLIYEDGTKYAKKRGDGIDGRYSSPAVFCIFYYTESHRGITESHGVFNCIPNKRTPSNF